MESCVAQICLGNAANSTFGQIFLQLIQSLLSAQCALADNSIYPEDRTPEVLENPEFDFIIVGGGTAGSIVASRLSENPNWTVLLIERGKDPSLISRIPSMFHLLRHSPEDYSFKAEPNDRYCQGEKEKRCDYHQGKVLGGGSVINSMIHVHGHKNDFDTWSQMGNDGWSYEQVLPYFRKSENYHPDVPLKFGPRYFGVGGPVNIRSYNDTTNALGDLVMRAGEELGYPKVGRFNGQSNIGFGRLDGAVDLGRRVDMATAFLSLAKNRNNLFLMKSTRVDSVITRQKRAIGVRAVLEDGRKLEIRARKEIVVSAGALNSPKILMLSGIGPKDDLERLGLRSVQDLPVGRNLQDHVSLLYVFWAFRNRTRPSPGPTESSDAGFRYLIHKDGPLASSIGVQVSGFVDTEDPGSDFPNVQFGFAFLPKNQPIMVDSLVNGFNFDEGVRRQFEKINKDLDLIAAAPIGLHPKSAGVVKLRSKSPEDPVQIFLNYFHHKEDVDVLLKGVGFLMKMGDTQSFKRIGAKLILVDVEGCRGIGKGSSEYWKCLIRNHATSLFHPTGTCKMGPAGDKDAVVDSALKVHGVQGLRVIDASIMPTITSGNTNSPTMMIAEKGCDLVKNDWMDV